MRPIKAKAIRGGLLYETEKSELLAGDDFMLGGNYEKGPKRDTNTFLYVTKNGRYFEVLQNSCSSVWKLEITPLTTFQALDLWSSLENRRVEFESAFPNTKIQDA